MSRDFSRPVDPAARPGKSRATVRLLVLDPDDRLLLFHSVDPGVGRRWWETPGGGIDPGETPVQTAVRELREETGQDLGPDAVVGPIAHRQVVHGYSDVVVEQEDTFYLVRTPAFEVDTAGFTDDEVLMTLGHRWWSAAELRTTDEEVWPANLLDLAALVAEEERWPVTLPSVEESSVPV